MAPLTRSIYYKLPELSMDAPRMETKDIQASSYPICLANPQLPRLVTFKSKSGTCSYCSITSPQLCADCCVVFYCNSACQASHWPKHKEMCQDLKDQHSEEVMEAINKMELSMITEDLGKMISSEFKCLNYKKDPKLSVNIDESASFGDLYDVSEGSTCTLRHFHPGTYTCTSVTPDDSCAPITIYHHACVDPVKVMKQCVLMSKDIFEHNDIPNQITMPQWCNWESADDEYIPSDSESEASESEFYVNEVLFADFIERVFDDTLGMASDSEDDEYDPSESESDDFESSDESGVSDHEVDYLINESKLFIRNLPLHQRRQIAPAADMEFTDESEDDQNDYDVEIYNNFKNLLKSSSEEKDPDIDDSDYLPYSDSESDSGDSVPEREISDSELYISDSEVEVILESSKDIRDVNDEMYDEFMDKVFDMYYIQESDSEDEDYIPDVIASDSSSEEDEISDSEEKVLHHESKDFIKNLPMKRQSYQTECDSSESSSLTEVTSEEELYEDFKIHTEAKYDLSDTEDLEYILEESDTESSSSEDEMEISDAESEALVEDSKDDMKDVSGHKRKCGPSDNHDCQDFDTEAEMESDDELYNDFRSKLIVSDASKTYLDGSDDEEFVPPAESLDCSQDESQNENDSQDESWDEGSQVSDTSEMDVSDAEISDLELSSEDELYEEFKDEVCQTQRKLKAQKKLKAKTPSDNKELMFFMNSHYTSSLKDSWKIENGSEIAGSLILKSGSKSSGIAIEMKGQNWRSAHVFEDSTSGKAFALVISTDTWEHLSKNYEHLEEHYPNQKWSSVAECELKFQMKDFLY